MTNFEERVLDLFEAIHPLDRIARAGYVLRGVTEPESVAAHSHFVALLAMLLLDARPELGDREKTLAMALLHDLPEAQLMDIPMPAADAHLKDAKTDAELAIARDLFGGFPERYMLWLEELAAASSPEARLVRGLDKLQMMIKILMYQREQRGRLDEFWANPRNFEDFGVEPVSRLFDALCRRAGRDRPRAAQA